MHDGTWDTRNESTPQSNNLSLAALHSMPPSLINNPPPGSPAQRRHNPSNIRHCFFIDGSWWLRLNITEVRDDIEVSPEGLEFLGAPFRQREVATTLNHSFILDNPGDRSGRILHFFPVLRQMRAAFGDYIWLNPYEIHGDGAIRIRRFIAKPDRPAFKTIARMCGILTVAEGDDLRRKLAAALALPTRAPWRDLIEHLATRGDQDLAELVSRYVESGCSPDYREAPAPQTQNSAAGDFAEFLALLREPQP